MVTSCGNRTSPWPRHLTFPLARPIPPPFQVCVYNASEGSVTACFPLSYHSCPTHTLHPVGLPSNEREGDVQRRGQKVRQEVEKQEMKSRNRCESTETIDLNSCVVLCVCGLFCGLHEFPAGSSLSAVHCAGKGVSLGIGCL